jgi:hypothetical protein
VAAAAAQAAAVTAAITETMAMAALSTATEAVRPRPGGRRTISGPDRVTVLLLTVAAFLGVLSFLARELEAGAPVKIARPVVVTRRVYETRVVTTVRGGSGGGTGTSVSQSRSNFGPVSAAPAASTRSS